uniref:C-C motif chemokine 3-like n=1 Tax=Bos indicus x Bos taurus TaxID=30522 RepID=A0A4W2GMM3_BOBOX
GPSGILTKAGICVQWAPSVAFGLLWNPVEITPLPPGFPRPHPPHCLLQVCLTLEGPLAAFPPEQGLTTVCPSLIVGANTPTACCFSFVSRQIPRKFVDDYYETSSQCSAPLHSFKTKRGRQVCADPSEDWVQEYITDLELNP